MKRCLFVCFALLLWSGLLPAQNLVPNPSLETTSPCPSGGGQINNAASWTSYLNSPDYYHSCGSGNFTTPGPNLGGTQIPADGNAYVAMVCRHSSSYYREHMGAQLISPLVPGQSYNCVMKVSLTDISQYAANRMGFLFTTTPTSAVNNFAHVYTNSIVTDKNGWVTVSGSFTPTVPYSYVIIGNFYNDAGTSINTVAGGWYAGAYYFVDSISVTPSVVLPASQVHLDLLEVRDGRALLGWEAQEDHEISGFVLERSTDGGINFTSRADLTPEAERQQYRYADVPGRYHVPILYRVRSIDRNGNTHLSNTVEVTLAPGGTLAPDLYPNPVVRGVSLTLRFQPLAAADHEVQLTDLLGRQLRTRMVPAEHALEGIEITTSDLSTGTYLVRVKSGSTVETRKFSVVN
ncbi:MAG: T9SS type A sorting domain-containing protein [Bacteroidota bacterium]